MVIVGSLAVVALVLWRHLAHRGRAVAATLALLVAGATPLVIGPAATAAIVPTITLGTTAAFSVLAGTTVTNTGPTTLQHDLGLSPGSAVTGFPPGTVTPPATQEVANGVALQAQSDLTTAYDEAAGRPLNGTTGADLVGLTLQGGVYAATTAPKAPFLLSGTVTLDGANDPSSVWVFQTDSTLITASNMTVNLINGASACNVFWQVGSSATFGTGTSFVGTVMALTSAALNDGVTVNGRVLARNGAVTMINDTFTGPDCTPAATTTTQPGGSTTVATTASTAASSTSSTGPTSLITGMVTTVPGTTTSIFTIPRTGRETRTTLTAAALAFDVGALALALGAIAERRRRAGTRPR